MVAGKLFHSFITLFEKQFFLRLDDEANLKSFRLCPLVTEVLKSLCAIQVHYLRDIESSLSIGLESLPNFQSKCVKCYLPNSFN